MKPKRLRNRGHKGGVGINEFLLERRLVAVFLCDLPQIVQLGLEFPVRLLELAILGLERGQLFVLGENLLCTVSLNQTQ